MFYMDCPEEIYELKLQDTMPKGLDVDVVYTEV